MHGHLRLAIGGFAFSIAMMGSFSHSQAEEMRIWRGPAPGSESWTQQERTIRDTPIGTVIFNVLTPTITPYLPDRAKAGGTAVIVAPGGGCVALSRRSKKVFQTSIQIRLQVRNGSRNASG